MKKILFIIGGILLIIGGWFLFKNTPNQKQSESQDGSIKLGWISPLSGDVAAIGKDALVSAQLAVEDVNREGGVNGKKIELIVEDGRCNPKDGVQAGNKLMNVDNVSVIMPMCSPELLSIAPQAEVKKTVLLSSCASAPKISQSGDYIFRTYPSDSFQGTFAAEYAYSKLGKRKAAILAIQNDWGAGLRDTFKKRFEELGGTIADVQNYSPDTKDLRTELSKIKNANPDMLYFPGFTQSTVIGLKQAKDIGLTVPLLGGDAWDDPTILKESAAEGIMYTLPKAQYRDEWKEKMRARGANTTTCAPTAYDNIRILADIMKRVGIDGEQIKNELYKVKNYNGVNGTITIDQNGDLATAEYDVKIVRDGKAVVQ